MISAVLVLEPNREATLKSALERFAGAIIGTIVGLGAMAAARPEAFPWALPLAMFVMGGIVAWKRRLRYGLVAAAGLAVGSSAGFIETAQSRGIAIFVGALAGILVGWLFLPQPAFSRARRQLGEALSVCQALLEDVVELALDERDAKLHELHVQFSRAIARAADTANGLKLRRKRLGRAMGDAVRGAERLWHALIILDRVTEKENGHGMKLDETLRRNLHAIRQQACSALETLGEFEPIEDGRLQSLSDNCSEARRAVDRVQDEQVETAALIFGLGEVARNVREIDSAVRAMNDRQARAGR